jgi:hypothetical protein
MIKQLKPWFRPSTAMPLISTERRPFRAFYLLAVALLVLASLPSTLASENLKGIEVPLAALAAFGIIALILPLFASLNVWLLGLIVRRNAPEERRLALSGFLWSWSLASLALFPYSLFVSWLGASGTVDGKSFLMDVLGLPVIILQCVLWSRFLEIRWGIAYRRVLGIMLAIECAILIGLEALERAFK